VQEVVQNTHNEINAFIFFLQKNLG